MTRDTDYARERGEADFRAGVRFADHPKFDTAAELTAWAEAYYGAQMAAEREPAPVAPWTGVERRRA